jgi:cbb3-type cytochrome oxidase maturation protein
MEVLAYLVPLALALGLLGLTAFLWSLKTGQYDDLEGAAWRAIIDDDAPVGGPIDSATRGQGGQLPIDPNQLRGKNMR